MSTGGTDTNITAPAEGHLLHYDNGSSKWINAAPALTTETLTLALPISGPFVATTMSVTLVRIQTAPTESIVTMRTTTIDETGNSLNEEILIDATNIPVRFRPTSDQRFVGVSTSQGGIHETGWLNAVNSAFWRFWRTSANDTWQTGSTVRVYATSFTWISV